MYSIKNDPRLNDFQKQLFLYPHTSPKRDEVMGRLLNTECDVKEFLGSRGLRHYQNNTLKVGDDLNLNMIAEAILVVSRDYMSVMNELKRTGLFDEENHHIDPTFVYFKDRVASYFDGRKLTTQHHEVIKSVPGSFATFRHNLLFDRMRHRRQRQYETSTLINNHALRETKRASVTTYQYFAVSIPESTRGTDAIRKWVQDFRARFVSYRTRPFFWVFMLDYHTESGLFLRAVVSKEHTDEFLSQCGENVLFSTQRLISDTWLKDVVNYTFRKHQLISPVSSMQRVIFRSY